MTISAERPSGARILAAGSRRVCAALAGCFALAGCMNLDAPCAVFDHADAISWSGVTAARVRQCVALGGDADTAFGFDHGGTGVLHYAAAGSGDPEVIAALIEAGAELNARDSRGRTPLHWTVSNSEPRAAVSALIRGGAEIDAVDENGETPVRRAEREGNAAAMHETVAALQEERRRQRAEAA